MVSAPSRQVNPWVSRSLTAGNSGNVRPCFYSLGRWAAPARDANGATRLPVEDMHRSQ
jgi:hypothetical protein